MITTIKIDNLKCVGCVSSIQLALLTIKGAQKVNVNIDTDDVTLIHADNTDLQSVRAKLKRMGYPETGTAEGIEKLTTGLRSYVSCAIGKLHKKENEKITVNCTK
jgi:copper chaperone